MRVISAQSVPFHGNILVGLLRYRALIRNLVVKDLRLKYRDAVLGFIWSLVLPLFTTLVYYLAFGLILKLDFPNYIVFLVVSLLSWNFFATSTLSSTTSIVGNSSLVRKVAFPWEVLPISCVLFHLVQFLVAMGVLLLLMPVLSTIRLGWQTVWLVPVIGLHVLFTIGVAMSLSVAATLWRDVRHMTEMALPLLFWITPIVYTVDRAPERMRMLLRTNPLGAFAITYQDILFNGSAPTLARSAMIAAWTVAALLVGYLLMRGYYTRLVEEL